MNELNPSTVHPDFIELQRKYHVTLDAFSGDVSKYVPYLSGQTSAQHEKYVQRASYFGVVERTAQAIVGAMTRKPFYMPEGSTFPLNDYGSADLFLQYQIRDLLLGGRTAILVDVEDGKSKLISYDADDIINWSDDFIVIREVSLQKDPNNRFNLIPVETWRELYLEDDEYRVRRWSMGKNKKWVSEELDQLLVNGKPLSYIPLFTVTPYDNSWDIYNPPLYVQAAMNIQHFKQAVDIGHYAHFMAIPTFTIIGDLASYEEEIIGDMTGFAHPTESGRRTRTVQTSFNIGSTEAPLHLTQGSSAQYTEVSGASFNALQSHLDKIEERMMIAGSRLLTSKRGVESAESLQIRAGAESAVLETITNALETALNNALQLCQEIDRSGDLTIELNKDFTAAVTDPAQIKALLELYTAEVITLDQFLEHLYAGEVLPQPGTKNGE